MASSESTSPCLASGAEDAAAANGINGTAQPQTPPSRTASQDEGLLARTPSLTSFALTEYSANPTPPSEDKKTRTKKIVPDEFLLPNGHPDVSCLTLCPAPSWRLHVSPLSGAIGLWRCHRRPLVPSLGSLSDG